MRKAYEPSAGLMARVKRRMTVYQARNNLSLSPGQTIVSFSFDDCPLSGITHGVKRLERENWLSTVYISGSLLGTENHLGKMMGPQDVQALNDNGHEIGEHTFSHIDASTVALSEILADIEKNQAYLNSIGIPASKTMAYPFGQTTPALKKAMQARFLGARGIRPAAHISSVDLNQISSMPLFSSTVDQLVQAIQKTSETGGWLTLFTHDICENPSEWGCTMQDIEKVISAIKNSEVKVMTIKDAITELGNAA